MPVPRAVDRGSWVLMACAQAMRPPALPPWFDDYPEEDEEEEPPSQ